MIPPGDTKSHVVMNWAFDQAEHLGGSDHHLLLVLAHSAFYRADNPENAPVGQVLAGFSHLDVLAQRTGLSASTVKRSLQALQADHGYLIRTPRTWDGEQGRPPRVIRLYWTDADDATRAAFRAGRIPLPEAFKVSAYQLETRKNRAHLRPVMNDRY